MQKNKYELSLLINNKPTREYYHNSRFFVEAKQNSTYTLRLKNHTANKILAVVSVDGIDVIKGKSASNAESGYVVNPFSTLNIAGYRIDDNNVASFKFEGADRSYASLVENDFDEERAKQSPSRNNGVIGVRIWEEKEKNFIPVWKQEEFKMPKIKFYEAPNFDFPYNYWQGGNPLPQVFDCLRGVTPAYSGMVANSINNFQFTSQSICESSITPDFELGTSWGQKLEDKVIKTEFEKADSYIELNLFYLKREELIKIGVDVENAKKVFVSGYPEAFGTEYCKKPSNWNK